jgi:ferric-chelate reductase [NAD(P)H]
MIDVSTLFKLTYGLYLLTANEAGKLYGCIINSAIQVTAEPPSLLVSTNLNNQTTNAILSSGKYCVSILTQEADMRLIGRFGFRSSSELSKFEGMPVAWTAGGLPVLSSYTKGYVECKVTGSYDAHTHKVIFGDITEAKTFDNSMPVLTYEYYHQVIKGKTPKNAATYTSETVKA